MPHIKITDKNLINIYKNIKNRDFFHYPNRIDRGF